MLTDLGTDGRQLFLILTLRGLWGKSVSQHRLYAVNGLESLRTEICSLVLSGVAVPQPDMKEAYGMGLSHGQKGNRFFFFLEPDGEGCDLRVTVFVSGTEFYGLWQFCNLMTACL